MMKNRVIQIIAFCFHITLCGQDNSDESVHYKNSIHFFSGIDATRFIDEGFTDSKLLFSGVNAIFSVGYSRETENSVFNFLLTGSSGKLYSKSGNIPTDIQVVHPAIEYLKKLKKFNLPVLGGDFITGGRLSSVNYIIESEKALDNIDVLSVHGLYLNISNRWNIGNRHTLQATYLLPVLAYENRILWNSGASEFTRNDLNDIFKLLTTNGEFTYMDLLGNIQFNLNYSLKVGNGFDIQTVYHFMYLKNSTQAALKLYTNQFLLGMNIKF